MVPPGVQGPHLGPHHPGPRPVVGSELDVVPGGGEEVGDDDVLLLRPEGLQSSDCCNN